MVVHQVAYLRKPHGKLGGQTVERYDTSMLPKREFLRHCQVADNLAKLIVQDRLNCQQ